MSNTRLVPKLYFADWMNKRGKETPEEQAIRMANNVKEALRLDPECKIGLLYSANMIQADALNKHYMREHSDKVPESILDNGSGQAKLFQAFIRHINVRWTKEERARVRIVGIPTSRRGGKDIGDNAMTKLEIQAVINRVHQLIDRDHYAVLGMRRSGVFNEFSIGGGVSKHWIEDEDDRDETRDVFFQRNITRQAMLETAPEYDHAQIVQSDKSFFQSHPRAGIGLAIFGGLVALALIIAAIIATCGAAGVPLLGLGAGIVAAGTTTIVSGFSVFGAVAAAGFLLGGITAAISVIGYKVSKKHIEMNKIKYEAPITEVKKMPELDDMPSTTIHKGALGADGIRTQAGMRETFRVEQPQLSAEAQAAEAKARAEAQAAEEQDRAEAQARAEAKKKAATETGAEVTTEETKGRLSSSLKAKK